MMSNMSRIRRSVTCTFHLTGASCLNLPAYLVVPCSAAVLSATHAAHCAVAVCSCLVKFCNPATSPLGSFFSQTAVWQII